MKTPAEASELEAKDNEYVSAFARLANGQLLNDAPARERQSFARIQERLAEAPASPSRVWAKPAGVALAATVLLGVGAWSLLAHRHITFERENVALSSGKYTGGEAGGALRFSDGSEVALSPGSVTSVAELTAHGGNVRVEQGVAHVAIAKKPGAAWFLLAGPYTVRVTGTAFDIGWKADEQRFDISMQSGSVLITGPLAPAGVPLEAGQHLQADRALTVAANDAPVALPPSESAAGVASAAAADSTAVIATPDPDASALSPAHQAGRAPSWREQVAHGHFAAVLAEAEKRGLPRALASVNLEDLAALGDAARYAQRPDISRRALLSQRHRFPGTAQAKDAAFFLGSLDEGQPGAIEWYDRYLQESPQGTYAAQALGRKLVYVYGQHRTTEAREIALLYNARYPNGPYASTARKVLAEPTSTSTAP